VLDLVDPAGTAQWTLGGRWKAGFDEVGSWQTGPRQHGAINSRGPGRVESDLSVKTKTHFAFRVDIWDDTGDSIIEHVAGMDDFEVAEATYRAAVARWPAARITLRGRVPRPGSTYI
jgi:hypothetical protein